jgi:hypothetical protein
MAKDRRYITVKNLITAGYIKSFREIFETIPKSVVARDLGMNNARFTRLMNDVGSFTLEELFRLSVFLEIEGSIIVNLTLQQFDIDKKARKKVSRD